METRKDFINEKQYSYFNNTLLNEYSIWLEQKLTEANQALQLRQCAVSGLLPAETTLKWIDDFVPCYVTECCGIGPIITDNYCQKCGKKIKRQ